MGDPTEKPPAPRPRLSRKTPPWLVRGLSILLPPVLLWLVFGFYRPFEPHYHGKCLSRWADDYIALDEDGSSDSPETQRRNREGKAAIQQIGTRALPLAVAFCQTRRFEFEEKFIQWFDDQSDQLHIDMHIAGEMENHQKGIAILAVLGSKAKPAIPALIKVLQGWDGYIYDTAMQGLGVIGPDSVPPLIEMIAHGKKQERYNATQCLGYYFRRQGSNAVPVLLQALESDDPALRGMAAESLASIDRDPGVVVPPLLAHLKTETNSKTLYHIVAALRIVGTNARPATPMLIKFAEAHQYNALLALDKIDPVAANMVFQKWRAEQNREPNH